MLKLPTFYTSERSGGVGDTGVGLEVESPTSLTNRNPPAHLVSQHAPKVVPGHSEPMRLQCLMIPDWDSRTGDRHGRGASW